MSTPTVFIGTDSGATTSKTGGVWADGSPISTKLRQSSTNSQDGTAAVIKGWVEGVEGFLADNKLAWPQVAGIGLALPGPYQSYGVLDRSANLPLAFAGWNFHADYSAALAQKAGRVIPLVVGNDGDLGGVGEAARARGDAKASVVLLAPGSGLGTAYIDARGLPLSGDHLAGMEAGHMPSPLQLLGDGLDKVAPCSPNTRTTRSPNRPTRRSTRRFRCAASPKKATPSRWRFSTCRPRLSASMSPISRWRSIPVLSSSAAASSTPKAPRPNSASVTSTASATRRSPTCFPPSASA